jgi:hypothetical protein
VILSTDPATHGPWVRQNQDDLRQAAMGCFQTGGRGALVVDWNDDLFHTAAFSITYCTDLGLRQSGIGWPNQETAEIVRTYNPACEYILILIDPGGIDRSYTYKVAYAS